MVPEEFFAIRLIQFADDILDGIVKSGNNDMLDSIYTSIGDTDDLVQNHESRLQRCDFYERF